MDGSDARDVFARVSALRLPDGPGYVQGDVARVAARVFVDDEAIRVLVPAYWESHLRRRARRRGAGRMTGLFRRRTYLPDRELRRSYDVVIVGGGVNGLSLAYHLAAKHRIRDVAVIERSLHRERRQRPQHAGAPRQLQHARDRASVRREPRDVPDGCRRSSTSTSCSRTRASSTCATRRTRCRSSARSRR